ncbi:uncharacterized protein troap isoform X2 [Brachyhypopomus gauderio]|uniref:uncharacterized protein troap isoform X2 n=1 Tax=Brachyhypopomus gauderio TaxID=698409 RepID=UPI0040416304
MASSSNMGPQNNKQKEFTGILKNQELNKMSESSRTKPLTVQASKRGSENQDPNETKHTKVGNKMKSVSRLPVLVKSMQTVSTVVCKTPIHNIWEERPLLGKAQKRKTSTKAVPLGLSTASVSVKANRSGAPLGSRPLQAPYKPQSVPQNRTELGIAVQSAASLDTRKHLPSNTATINIPLGLERHTVAVSKVNKAPSGTVLAEGLFNELASSVQKDLSTRLGGITLTHSDLANSVGISRNEDTAGCQIKTKSCIQTPLSAKCTRTTGVCAVVQSEGVDSFYLPQRVSVKKKACSGSQAAAEYAVPFSPDPEALSSILLNEGVKVGDPGATMRVSVCPSGRGTSVYSAQRVPVRNPQTHVTAGPVGDAVSSSPTPSASRNILLNEGIKVGSSVGTTPRASVLPSGRGASVYSAQRVPIKKAQTEMTTTLPRHNGGAMPFSPDPAALSSNLLNEGVKVEGPAVTPRASACPLARGTPVYSAQRVPVKKHGTEAPTLPGASRTPARSQTQQRVPYSQHKSVRRLISAHKASLSGSPGLRYAQAPATDGSGQHEEHVVQRLFQEEPEQKESEQPQEGEIDAVSGQAQEHHRTIEPGLKQEGDMEPDRLCSEKKELGAVQPFIQAAHRQSVIVFSSGRKPLKPGLGHAPPTPEEPSAVQTGGSQASSSSLAVCALRRRLPPLEEMFLDEECAAYTSSRAARPTQTRCTNPVASLLLLHDSTRFVPIGVRSSNLSPVSCLS